MERTSFSTVDGLPLSQWPTSFIEYAAKDAIYTRKVYLNQKASIPTETEYSHGIQVAADWALDKINKRGIRIDHNKLNEIWQALTEDINKETAKLVKYDWSPGLKGNRKILSQILRSFDIPLTLTATGKVSSKAEDLENFRNIEFIDSYCRYVELFKARTFLKGLDGERAYPKYNLLVNTGRTSCTKPNFQQLPKTHGIRYIFVPDYGCSFIIADYSTIELRALGFIVKTYYHQPEMVNLINSGVDLHAYCAKLITGKDTCSKQDRQMAKAVNFGFPGGMGVMSFIDYAKKSYGVDISYEDAKKFKKKWHDIFPGTREFLEDDYSYCVTSTGRIRANASYCASKNTQFQGLAADGAKLALYYLVKAGYDVVGFVHDEFIIQVATAYAETLRPLIEEKLKDGMQEVMPGVNIDIDSYITTCYDKT